MEKVINWAHETLQGYLPDLQLNGPLDAEDIVSFLRDRYYDEFFTGTTQEVRDALLIVAQDYV